MEIIDDIRFYLSERFRLRFEDVGFDELAEEADSIDPAAPSQSQSPNNDLTKAAEVGFGLEDQNANDQRLARELESSHDNSTKQVVIRTLDGQVAGDEFAQDALNYQILLGKIDTLLDELKLDA